MENVNICGNQMISFKLRICASKPFGGQALPEPDGRAYSAPHSPDSRPPGLRGRGKTENGRKKRVELERKDRECEKGRNDKVRKR